MLKLAHAAYAAALVSVMAIPGAPANAQESADLFYNLACIDSKGLCYTDDSAANALNVDGSRFVNIYRPGGARFVNAYQPDVRSEGIYLVPGSSLAPGLFGIALEEQLANRSTRFTNRYVGGEALVVEDNTAACQARYRSYDASTGMYLGYDGNYHPCRL